MRKRLINLVIDACYRIDEKCGKLNHYEGETAPYCGHHYSGTDGVLYSAYYREGDGGERADVLGFRFGRDTDDEYWWSFRYNFKIVKDLYISGEKEASSLAWTNISSEIDSFIKVNIKTKHMRFKHRLERNW